MPESTNLHEPAWLAQWPRYFIDTLEIYAVFAIDLSGVILSWQPGVKHVFGYERESFVAQPADIIFTEVDRQNDAPEREMGIALRNGWAKDERWHVCKNGARFWGSGIMIAVRDDSEQVVGFAKLVRDRTSERLEDEVKDLTALRLEGNLIVQDEHIRTLAEDLTLAEQRERRRIHRFTPGSKEVLQSWYPNSSLEMDEDERAVKRNKFSGLKYVYPKDVMGDLKAFFETEIALRFPKARILYWT